MHCFICVTYMIILCSVDPTRTREITTTHEKRSLFHDVIESLGIHSQLPDDLNQNEENILSQNYVRYGYENEPSQLPSDAEYIPRRNDRIEMPSLKHRFPKSIDRKANQFDWVSELFGNQSSTEFYPGAEYTPSYKVESGEELKSSDKLESSELKTNENGKLDEEIKSKVTESDFVDNIQSTLTSLKPKKVKRPRPSTNKYKNFNKTKQNPDDVNTDTPDTDDYIPLTNTMNGQSQIGNRDSQMVLKPTVIVNIRGSVNHRDSDIRIKGREETEQNTTEPIHNIFNINQEITIGSEGNKIKPSSVKQEIKTVTGKEISKIKEDMMMCETATWKPDKIKEIRKVDSVLQILFPFRL